MADPIAVSKQPEVQFDCRNMLGESPVWDERDERLYWVNIHAAELWAWRPGSSPRIVRLPERVGAIGLREQGGLVLALESGFGLLDTLDAEIHTVRRVDAPAHTRMNDGRVDPFGRFVCGGMNEETPQGSNAALYSLAGDGRVTTLLDGIGCTNSLCWSPDGRTMYFSDMPTGRIDAFDYDASTGAISNRRRFATLAKPGAPDGSIVDAEGHLWNAQWGGAKLVRYRPDGSVEREVPLPVSNPSCVAFGGPDLDILYVTSAWFTLDDATRAREPHAGSLFALRPGVLGLPCARFAG
ncbi:SMP-30/gluconolactonase/LRE family protein [Paraburkholderia tropica]|uniref:SMP-30/gluconolactonase/LRE family protein n=1 Tax=Paraburkholderia tropica TaxID=92647 RepID=UPI002AB795BA|nr:SMP-30/gluconolactonase/LRE family protein [Paraburkholderia tropica]